MNYNDWLASIAPEFTDDPLWRMEVYRFAVLLVTWRGPMYPGWQKTSVPLACPTNFTAPSVQSAPTSPRVTAADPAKIKLASTNTL